MSLIEESKQMTIKIDEKLFFEKLQKDYDLALTTIIEIEPLPRNLAFEQFSNTQFNFLNSLIQNYSTLFVNLDFKNDQNRTINIDELDIINFNKNIHKNWKIEALWFDYLHAALNISVNSSEEIQYFAQENLPKTTVPNIKKVISVFAIITSVIFGILSFFLHFHVGIAASVSVFMLSCAWLIIIYFNNSAKKLTLKQRTNEMLISHYFSAHLGDYANQKLYLDKDLES